VGADEAGTVAAVNRRWENILKPVVLEHRGRIVKFMGDGALMEFASAVDAVRAALELQKSMSEENERALNAPVIQLRVGVNLGDVIADGGDIFGDDVNIASRLEALARPGEICVSQSVYDAVRGKLDFASEALGDVALKNIAKSVRAYRVAGQQQLSGPPDDKAASETRQPAAALPPPHGQLRDVDKSSTIDVVETPLSRIQPTLLTILIFPFRTIGPNTTRLSLDEGLFEDITANLTRYRDLEVIRMSADAAPANPAYRDGYTLNGTVQYGSDAVRITVTLVENGSSRSIWSERWDRKLEDAFTIQSEIADGVVNSLAGYSVLMLTAAERAARKPPANRSAYELYLIGRSHNNRFSREDATIALEHFRSATKVDPDFARAWLGIAWSYDQLGSFTADTSEYDVAFLAAARRAVDLDPVDAEAYLALGEALGNVGEMEEAEKAFDRALMLGPGNADVLAMFAGWAPRFGRQKEGELAADKARRLNPRWSVWYNNYFRRVYFFGGRYEEALSCVTRKPPKSRSLDDLVYAACCSAVLGRAEEANRWRGEALAMGYVNAEHYLLYSGVFLPDQRELVSRLLQLAGFE
jgi:TolB-like protein